MKKEDGVKLSKRTADGKIAYLIKPILKVLQDAGGQLERSEIKERIADLDYGRVKLLNPRPIKSARIVATSDDLPGSQLRICSPIIYPKY